MFAFFYSDRIIIAWILLIFNTRSTEGVNLIPFGF